VPSERAAILSLSRPLLLRASGAHRFRCERKPGTSGSDVIGETQRRPKWLSRFPAPLATFEAITLRPVGELDIATAADAFGLGQIVGSAQRVILDFSEVTFIGAAALGAVVRLRNFAVGSGGDVELIAPPKVERVFVLDGLQVLLAAR
jgi:anti-anti-sigma regulatory factor